MRVPRAASLLAVVVLAGLGALAGCAGPGTRERTGGARSLYALVSIAYDDSRVHGTFKSVVQYKAPGRIRITAFKDVALVASGEVFDLLITPEVFSLTVAPHEGEPGERDQGSASELPTRHPGFRGFAWAREELFMPGSYRGVPFSSAGWGDRKRPQVLARYADYRHEGEVWIPGSIDYEDAELSVRMKIRLLELELNPELDDALFRPESVGASPK